MGRDLFTKRTLARILGLICSISILSVLYSNIETTTFLDTLSNVISFEIFLFYSVLSILSLIARTQRYRILFKNKPSKPLSFPLAFLAHAVRNLAMTALPFRIGEMAIPAILKLSKYPIVSSIHPLWISALFDFSALLFVAGSYLSFCAIFPDSHLGIKLLTNSALTYPLIFFCFFISVVCMTLPKISKGLLFGVFRYPQLKKLLRKYPLIVRSANSIKKMSLGLTIRVFLLSIIVRLSKYTALGLLFFSAHTAIPPNTERVLMASICFIFSESVSSLPGSGFLSFGAYEIAFVWLAGLSEVLPEVTLGSITSVHVLSFSYESILMLCCAIITYVVIRRSKAGHISDNSSTK